MNLFPHSKTRITPEMRYKYIQTVRKGKKQSRISSGDFAPKAANATYRTLFNNITNHF